MLNIISALEKGIVPVHFSAWLWKIARNRYSAWVGNKRKQAESELAADIWELETEEKTADIEESLIHDTELQLLYRELSFISSDYRNIIVAYYLQGIKTSEIARSLNFPEDTVMSKLYRARKVLKEGMNMTREFGKRNYNPETISLCASGNQPSGLPWSANHFVCDKLFVL